MTERTEKEVARLKPASDAELALELHGRLREIVGETADLLNDPRYRRFNAGFALGRDATGRWFVQGIQVNLPA